MLIHHTKCNVVGRMLRCSNWCVRDGNLCPAHARNSLQNTKNWSKTASPSIRIWLRSKQSLKKWNCKTRTIVVCVVLPTFHLKIKTNQQHNVNAKTLQSTRHKIQCRPPLLQLQLYEDWFYPKKEARTCPAIVKKRKKHVSDNIEHPDMIQ